MVYAQAYESSPACIVQERERLPAAVLRRRDVSILVWPYIVESDGAPSVCRKAIVAELVRSQNNGTRAVMRASGITAVSVSAVPKLQHLGIPRNVPALRARNDRGPTAYIGSPVCICSTWVVTFVVAADERWSRTA